MIYKLFTPCSVGPLQAEQFHPSISACYCNVGGQTDPNYLWDTNILLNR